MGKEARGAGGAPYLEEPAAVVAAVEEFGAEVEEPNEACLHTEIPPPAFEEIFANEEEDALLFSDGDAEDEDVEEGGVCLEKRAILAYQSTGSSGIQPIMTNQS